MAANESSTPDLEEMEGAKNATTCSSCQESKYVVKYCVTCQKDCCITCADRSHEHHMILSCDHSIVKSLKLFQTDACTLHNDKTLSMYCVKCKTPCCHACLDESHDGHPMSTMESIAKKADSMFLKLVDDLPEATARYSQKQLEYTNYVTSVGEVITDIKSQFERLRLSIDDLEASMIEPLEKEVYEARKTHTDLGQPIVEAECLVHLYEIAKEEDSNIQKAIFLSNCPSLDVSKLEGDSYPKPISFESVSLKNLSAEEFIGSVITWDGQPLLKEETLKIHDDVQDLNVISLKSNQNVTLNGRVLPMMDSGKWLISDEKRMFDVEYNRYVVVTNLSTLDEDGTCKYNLDLSDGTSVTDISIIPPSDLVFTDSKRKRIWRVNISGTKTLVADTSPVTPTGICITSDKRLVLGLQVPGKTVRQLMRMYSLNDLKSLDDIENDDQDKPLFSFIKSIAQNSQEDFIVHDGDNLLCVSEQGSLKWKIKKDFEQFCIDKFCNIVVATEDEIRILDRNGKYIKTLLTSIDFLTTPTSLSIDKDGLLWIGQDESTKVVKYSK